MKTIITKKSFETSEIKINELLAIATQKGGFDNLTKKEKVALEKYTQVVKKYEEVNYKTPLPQKTSSLGYEPEIAIAD